MLSLRRRPVVAFFLFYLVWFLFLTGCSKTPAEPNIPLPPVVKVLTVHFSSDVSGTGSNRVVLTSAGGSFPLVLEVRLEEVTDFYRCHFDLLYPYNILKYSGFEEGTFSGLWCSGFGTIYRYGIGEEGVLRGRIVAENRQSRVT